MTDQTIITDADKFCEGLIARCQLDDRPYIYEQLIGDVLRPYLHILDAPNTAGQSSEYFADALSGLVATMMTTFIGRVVPSTDQEAAASIAQDFVNALGAALSADIAAVYQPKPKSQVIQAQKAFIKKHKGKIN